MAHFAIKNMEQNISVISQQAVLRLLLFLILISSYSTVGFSQTFYSEEKKAPVPEQELEQVVKRVLVWSFKPKLKPTVIYLAEQRIKQSWMPTIKNIEFRLVSSKEIQQKNLAVYFFTQPEFSAKTFDIVLMFGTVNCDYTGDAWRFRISKQKVRVWKSNRGFGGGCGIAFLDATRSSHSFLT